MRQGFTLLELSIVLVIIGLIIGGITVGADMIRSAELNAVVSEITKYKTAINTYKLKYNALAGDHKNAEAYWGQAATGAACLTTAGTGTQTCNGDGNGKIEHTASDHESWRSVQHLANAELINGSYSGISITGCTAVNNCSSAGENAYISKASASAAWHLMYKAVDINNSIGKAKSRNLLVLGNPSNLTGDGRNGMYFGLVLNPQATQSIDAKVDDGVPNMGEITIMSHKTGIVGTVNPNCATGSGSTMVYNLSFEEVACNLLADID